MSTEESKKRKADEEMAPQREPGSFDRDFTFTKQPPMPADEGDPCERQADAGIAETDKQIAAVREQLDAIGPSPVGLDVKFKELFEGMLALKKKRRQDYQDLKERYMDAKSKLKEKHGRQ